MDRKTQEIYSEVDSVLNMLGENYIKRIPSRLYQMIQDSKWKEYNPQYVANISLEKQPIKKESLSMIALLHLNYWCDSEEEKKQLEQIFQENEEKYQIELREKYNPDNLFKKKQPSEEVVAVVEKQEEKWYQKIVRFIQRIFKRK